MIDERRTNELGVLKKKLFAECFLLTGIYFFPFMLQAFTLITYVLLGNNITLAKMFVIISLINNFIFSLSTVGLYLAELIKFMVSMRRI